jgi:hypothetical protein
MAGKMRRRMILRWFGAVAALGLSLIVATRSIQALTPSVTQACEGNNLRITWSGLNASLLDGVSIEVNGPKVFANGASSGTFVVNGPGDWTITVYQSGDPVETFTTSCPGPVAPPPPDDPRIFPNGSKAVTNVAYKRDDGGFDLYMYNPVTQVGTLIFSMTCEDETKAAVQSERQYLAGQNPNISLFNTIDVSDHPVNVYFVHPDQIQIQGYFGDGKPHTYSFTACASAYYVELSTRTPTPTFTPTATRTNTPILPNIVLAASCTQRGNATYRITNNGGAMLSSGSWVVTANNSRIGSDTFRLQAGGVVTITSSGVYGNITFTTSGGGTTPQSVSTFCTPPTASPTNTPTNTLRPPQIVLAASCTQRGNATYRITNNGGDMLSSGNWVVTANGSRIGSDTFRVRAGGAVTITSSGVYGNITFTTSGGGTTPQSVSTFCVYPTATPTPTPR